MMNSQVNAVLSIGPGEARRVGQGAGEITVLRGRVWLTGECGDPDQILSPGQSLRVHDAQAVVIEAWDRGVSAAPVAAVLMAAELGWSAEKTQYEIDRYLARVAAERASQEQPDDVSADRVRREAPDVIPS
jgi:hypothetical protein